MSRKYKQPNCPVCNSQLDAVTGITKDVKPKPGDITLCLYCGEVMEFTKTGFKSVDIEKLTPETQCDIKKVQRLRKKFKQVSSH